jgi:hypothetical protein
MHQDNQLRMHGSGSPQSRAWSKRYDIAEFLSSDWCSCCRLVIGQGYAVGCHPFTQLDKG